MSFGERYLTFPDLFPGRPSGEPCGSAAVTLQCAAERYRVTGLSDAQARALRERFRGDALPADTDTATDVKIQVFAAAHQDFDYRPTPGEPYSFDTDSGSTVVRLAGRNFMARLERHPELSAAIWTPHNAEFVTYGDFENIFRVLIAQRLLDIGGVLLHSSGVVIDAAAHIFFGYSGAGKTTVARLGLAQGYDVLSDDIDLIVPGRQGPRATRSPFAGELGRTEVAEPDYPIAGVYLLEQARENAISALKPAQAVAALAARAPFINQDPFRAHRLMENLSALVDAVPASILRFDRSGGFWQLLHQGNPNQ